MVAITEKVEYLALPHKILRSKDRQFTLLEVFGGVNAAGDRFIEEDLTFEIDK